MGPKALAPGLRGVMCALKWPMRPPLGVGLGAPQGVVWWLGPRGTAHLMIQKCAVLRAIVKGKHGGGSGKAPPWWGMCGGIIEGHTNNIGSFLPVTKGTMGMEGMHCDHGEKGPLGRDAIGYHFPRALVEGEGRVYERPTTLPRTERA